MTAKEERKRQMLDILNEVNDPKDLQRAELGSPGCLIERVWGIDQFRRIPRYEFVIADGFESPTVIFGPNDQFVLGRITLTELKAAIARL